MYYCAFRKHVIYPFYLYGEYAYILPMYKEIMQKSFPCIKSIRKNIFLVLMESTYTLKGFLRILLTRRKDMFVFAHYAERTSAYSHNTNIRSTSLRILLVCPYLSAYSPNTPIDQNPAICADQYQKKFDSKSLSFIHGFEWAKKYITLRSKYVY